MAVDNDSCAFILRYEANQFSLFCASSRSIYVVLVRYMQEFQPFRTGAEYGWAEWLGSTAACLDLCYIPGTGSLTSAGQEICRQLNVFLSCQT